MGSLMAHYIVGIAVLPILPFRRGDNERKSLRCLRTDAKGVGQVTFRIVSLFTPPPAAQGVFSMA